MGDAKGILVEAVKTSIIPFLEQPFLLKYTGLPVSQSVAPILNSTGFLKNVS